MGVGWLNSISYYDVFSTEPTIGKFIFTRFFFHNIAEQPYVKFMYYLAHYCRSNAPPPKRNPNGQHRLSENISHFYNEESYSTGIWKNCTSTSSHWYTHSDVDTCTYSNNHNYWHHTYPRTVDCHTPHQFSVVKAVAVAKLLFSGTSWHWKIRSDFFNTSNQYSSKK